MTSIKPCLLFRETMHTCPSATTSCFSVCILDEPLRSDRSHSKTLFFVSHAHRSQITVKNSIHTSNHHSVHLVRRCSGRHAISCQSKVLMMRPLSSKILPDALVSSPPTTRSFLICLGGGSSLSLDSPFSSTGFAAVALSFSFSYT